MEQVKYFDFEQFFIDELYGNYINEITTFLSFIEDTLVEILEHYISQNGINYFLKNELPLKTAKHHKPHPNGKKMKICIGYSKYEAIRRVANQFGFKEVGENGNWNIYWTDGFIGQEIMIHLKEHQKINHFPGMIEICRKDLLARNVNRMAKLFTSEFNIIPKTWCLPSEITDFQLYCQKHKVKNFILKPEASCQGKGILITQNHKNLKYMEGMVCQVYIDEPLLVDDYKFDLRIYVLITSIDPLRIYAYNEGLVRFTTVKYEEPNQTNMSNIFMHLTNYTLQKTSENFIKDNEYLGTKRRISVLNQCFIDQGYDVDQIWQDIDDIIIKTIITVQDTLRHNYRNSFPNHVTYSACFEILGFDIILDNKLKPYLMEVNHSPSFHTDAQLDKEIKDALLWDTFQILALKKISRLSNIHKADGSVKRVYKNKSNIIPQEQVEDLRKIREQIFDYEMKHIGNFRLLYFTETSEKYKKYFLHNISLFYETNAYRARLQCARKLREELRKKNELYMKLNLKNRKMNQSTATSLKKPYNSLSEDHSDKIRKNDKEIGDTSKIEEEIFSTIIETEKPYDPFDRDSENIFIAGGDMETLNEIDAHTENKFNVTLEDGDVTISDKNEHIYANLIALSSICESNVYYCVESATTNICWHAT